MPVLANTTDEKQTPEAMAVYNKWGHAMVEYINVSIINSIFLLLMQGNFYSMVKKSKIKSKNYLFASFIATCIFYLVVTTITTLRFDFPYLNHLGRAIPYIITMIIVLIVKKYKERYKNT